MLFPIFPYENKICSKSWLQCLESEEILILTEIKIKKWLGSNPGMSKIKKKKKCALT